MAKIQGHNFTIGASIRLFTKNKIKDVALVKGSVYPHGTAIKVDVTPVSGEKTFTDNVHTLVNGNDAMISPVNPYPVNHLIKGKEIFDAYTGKPAIFATSPDSDGSGDVIINWTNDIEDGDPTHFEACSWLAKTLDQYLGLVSLLWDKNTVRRSDRGQPGLFTPTPTGMIYHTLSNMWVKWPQTRTLVYNNTHDAIKALFEDDKVRDKQYYGKSAADIIRKNEDAEVARLLDYSDIKSPRFYREKLGIEEVGV